MAEFTPAALAAEIGADPAALGYAPLVASGNDAGLAALLNDPAKGGTVALSYVERDPFLKALRPVLMTLPAKDAATQSTWDRVVNWVRAAEGVAIDAGTLGLLGAAVAAGLLSQDESDAVWHRPGSRAEALWGSGQSATVSDVSFALRGVR